MRNSPILTGFLRGLAAAFISLGIGGGAPAMAAPALKLEVYNPGANGVFPVSSELVTGARDAVLIDAQFQRNDAEALVERIRASGKNLTTIYISHSDPDFYFGLDVLKAAFPAAKIVATPQTVAAIQASMAGKKAYWSPILKGNAPRDLVLPEPLAGNTILLEGNKLEVLGLDGPAPERTVIWIPALRTVAGGVVVFGKSHVWIADTQTLASRQHWIAMLDRIEAKKPVRVVPGHYLDNAPQTLASVRFTRDYLRTFEREAARAPDGKALAAAMQQRYAHLGGVDSLELSAKVIKGEMTWPAK
ncbi:MBL fold metallo-hydrolase [Cupriavidus basilensis]|uniref:MBL fold metallo-hydrolase n=1 Tax=Cupriavidus basilensis TaxID=68895 RepID=A0ABT6AGH0_9BURK|nr:MBL fold metallo-hydrolase [Cupriavidus basilensis]MDF3831692.1 MBL fold metallo-hydrolase [Cupriavidus basilensis]